MKLRREDWCGDVLAAEQPEVDDVRRLPVIRKGAPMGARIVMPTPTQPPDLEAEDKHQTTLHIPYGRPRAEVHRRDSRSALQPPRGGRSHIGDDAQCRRGSAPENNQRGILSASRRRSSQAMGMDASRPTWGTGWRTPPPTSFAAGGVAKTVALRGRTRGSLTP